MEKKGHPNPLCHSVRMAGMTLIELLLALSIAVLLVALLYSLYRTSAVTAARQQQRMDGYLPAAEAVEELSRDLTCAFGPRGDDDCALTLEQPSAADPDGPCLAFCAQYLSGREGDITWTDVRRVTYRLVPGDDGGKRLVRISYPLAGPGFPEGPRTNLIVRDVRRFEIRVFDGDEWVEEWPVENAPPLPRAARVELDIIRDAEMQTLKTDVYIPAGNVIKAPE